MSKSNKILVSIQILAVVCLMLCNGSVAVNSIRKSDTFSCKGHQCGCESESVCKTHCCCTLYENQYKFKNNTEKQKIGFRTFMSTVNCKYGNDPLTGITFTTKYILESQGQPIKESFLCFLFSETSICLPEVFASPPEKPPRHFI